MDLVYRYAIFLHNLNRWLVLIFLLLALLRALPGWLGHRVWRPGDDQVGKRLTLVADLQLLLGLVLAGVSPTVRTAMGDMAAAMKDSSLRFWAVEHSALMLLAVVLIHIGRARSRRTAPDVVKHRRAAVYFGLALAAILAGMPWQWLATNGRPLFPELPF